MHVAIIGAGLSGLCAAKYSLAYGFKVTVFEMAGQLGGTWSYTDQVGTNVYGLDVQTSVYQGLRTVAPKEVMGFPDYPIQSADNRSYLSHEEVLKYLNDYADAFDVRQHIQLLFHVVLVRPLDNGQWELYAEDLVHNKLLKYKFDAVFVCNGHFHMPKYPEIADMNEFQGKQTHSHYYRKAEDFAGDKVLIIGSSRSGVDLAMHISEMPNTSVTISSNGTNRIIKDFPKQIDRKPLVTRLTKTGAEFINGSHKEFTTIIYCTGFKYSFPFLTYECGISIEDNFVQPLYKHCINIRHPTMAFIGIPVTIAPAPMFDIQVRFVLQFLSKRERWPSKSEMMADRKKDMEARWKKGLPIHKAHQMGDDQGAYWADLADTAKIKPIPPVLHTLFIASADRYFEDFPNFRSVVYKLVDDSTFMTDPDR